jgi:hypothetical protein
MRRLDRKRLFEVEKLGQNVDVGAAIGMKNAIVSATQHREGHKLTTDIVVDLGTSKDVVKTGGTGGGVPVGTEDASGTAQVSYIAQLTRSVFGIVTSIETICLEMPSDGFLLGSTTNAYQLEIGNANGKIGVAVGSAVSIDADMNSIGVLGEHSIAPIDDNGLENKYVYIATGAGAGTTTSATATITVGTSEDQALTIADIFTDEVSRLSLTKADGSFEHKFIDLNGAQAYNGSQTADKVNVKSATTAAHIALGIKTAFNAGSHSSFTANVGGSPNSHVVTITSDTAGVGGNQSNFFADAPGKTAPIVITDFTGGSTAGTSTAMTQGKFLIRVTGFVAPDDL